MWVGGWNEDQYTAPGHMPRITGRQGNSSKDTWAKGCAGRRLLAVKNQFYTTCVRTVRPAEVGVKGVVSGIGLAGEEVGCLQALVRFSSKAPWRSALPWLNPSGQLWRARLHIYCEQHRLRNVLSQALSAKRYFGTGRATRAARLCSSSHIIHRPGCPPSFPDLIL